jgi:hypothetical protein
MIDWTKSMSRTYEYYIVDPDTWRDKQLLRTIKDSTINRDSEVETRGSATIDIAESVGECYIRIYLIATQNGETAKVALGTFLVQTPSSSFNGKIRNVSMDAYTPLLELKENRPPLGYSLLKGENIMDASYLLIRDKVRAPVVKPSCDTNLEYDFVADPNDTYLSFNADLIANASYNFDVDEMGRILFAPKQDVASLQPVWTYTDDNSSILYPELSMDHDLYGIPNVVEVTFSTSSETYHTRVVNDDPNSPTSTINRGREIVYRTTNPEALGMVITKVPVLYEVLYFKGINAPIMPGLPGIGISMRPQFIATTNRLTFSPKEQIPIDPHDPEYGENVSAPSYQIYKSNEEDGVIYYYIGYETPQMTEYAERLLAELSSIEYTVSYTHGYCPVRVGDCVRLNYARAGLKNIKAKVISQSIKCTPDCPVTEKAVFTTKLWR